MIVIILAYTDIHPDIFSNDEIVDLKSTRDMWILCA